MMARRDEFPDRERIARALETLEKTDTLQTKGRITELIGLVLRASVPGVRTGDLVEIARRRQPSLKAEVVGFRGDEVILVPFGSVTGVGPASEVRPTGDQLKVRCGLGLMGRVLGGLGEPIDGKGPVEPPAQWWPVRRPAPQPLSRPRIKRPLAMGVRALDGLLTVGEGQRVGVFAGSGVGKSTLLGQIARNTEADVNVICLVGERGREVREFLDESLGDEGLARSVVVCATSDEPAFVRLTCARVATSVAEHFRDQDKRVLLLMDSVTRFARAQREVGLAAGEPPARRGYPPSVFASLPALLERTGTAPQGSITALYTVLVEGGDMEEPIADEVRGILDGHVVLSRELASRNHYPAIDVLHSLSRVMSAVTTEHHQQAASSFRRLLAAYESRRDLIALGAYKKGSEPEVDRALEKLEGLMGYLRQQTKETTTFEEAAASLGEIVS
jgi:type III secretion protein N (ATPase)